MSCVAKCNLVKITMVDPNLRNADEAQSYLNEKRRIAYMINHDYILISLSLIPSPARSNQHPFPHQTRRCHIFYTNQRHHASRHALKPPPRLRKPSPRMRIPSSRVQATQPLPPDRIRSRDPSPSAPALNPHTFFTKRSIRVLHGEL